MGSPSFAEGDGPGCLLFVSDFFTLWISGTSLSFWILRGW